MRSLLSLLTLLALAGANPSPAQDAAAARTLLVELGQPGLAVDVNGEPYAADDQGTLRLEIRAASEATLRFRSLDPAWTLDVERRLPAEDPGVAVLWDLTAELRPAPEAAPPAAAPDPCQGRKSLRCRQAKWRRFEGALAGQDCAAAIAAVEELEAEYPELVSAGPAVAAFAQAWLDCGLLAGNEAWIERSVELATTYGGGELWCDARASRVVARGFEALGRLADAAAGAAAARPLCGGENPAALEWEFYFRYLLGEIDRCTALAAAAPRRLGLFLQAWLELPGGGCSTEVELEASGDLPCRGLPQEFCSRQYGRILLACGTTGEDFATAARYLRAALPEDPAGWPAQLDGLVLELAEAELLSGAYASAVRHYERLLHGDPSRGEAPERAAWWRLYGDALMLSGSGDASRRAAAAAYGEARRRLDPGTVDFAVVINNLCVLRDSLEPSMHPSEIESDLEVLQSAVLAIPESEDRLRLRLWHNLLSLRIRRLENDTELDAQEKLARLRELRAPFLEYQRQLEAQVEDGLGVATMSPGASLEVFDGRRFVLALP